MSIRMRIGPWLSMLLLVCATAHASGVQASLSSDHVALGDTVTLTLRFPGTGSKASPDLSPLRKDFSILGQSTSSSESWVNGRVSGSYSIQISLRPRRAGTLRIPPLQIGGRQTKPLTLHVSTAPMHARGKPGDTAFVQVILDTHTPYVGQQVAVDVRLYYSSDLMSGSLGIPSADGSEVRLLGRSQRYQTMRDGLQYHVVERHYALIPLHAGTLKLAPVVFRGQALDQGGSGGFFSNAHQIGAQSASQTLKVKPRPASASSGPWLPARQVELNLNGLPASGQVQVGEPVTVTIQEGATGLEAEVLPKPTLPKLPGADVYPDQTHNVTRNNGKWVTGSRSRSFAIVPQRSGILHLPPITLTWWNVVADHEETARIPAHTLEVIAASAGAATSAASPSTPGMSRPIASAAVPASPSSVSAVPTHAFAARTKEAREGSDSWRWLALGSVLLWLLSLIVGGGVWWLARRRRRRMERAGRDHAQRHAIRVRTLRNAFLAAARSGDLSVTAHALLAWAQAERRQVRHLQDLAALLDDTAQRDAIGMLQRNLYAAQSGADDDPGGRIADAFRKGLAWRHVSRQPEEDDLPPLYPRS